MLIKRVCICNTARCLRASVIETVLGKDRDTGSQ